MNTRRDETTDDNYDDDKLTLDVIVGVAKNKGGRGGGAIDLGNTATEVISFPLRHKTRLFHYEGWKRSRGGVACLPHAHPQHPAAVQTGLTKQIYDADILRDSMTIVAFDFRPKSQGA